MTDEECAVAVAHGALLAAWSDLPEEDRIYAIAAHLCAIRVIGGDDAFGWLIYAALNAPVMQETIQ